MVSLEMMLGMSGNDPAENSPPLAEAETVMALLGERMRWRALRALADGSHLTVQMLAKRAGCHPDLMSRHLAKLRRAGLVRQVHPDGGNRRYHHYEIPAAYRREGPAGRREIDYGVVALRF